MSVRSREAVAPSAGSMTEPDFELTNEQWLLIEEFFPEPKPGPEGGRPLASSRACVEGIIWILISGAPWRMLPKCYPSDTTCWRRHKQWTEAGVWEKAWARLLRTLKRQGELNFEETIADGTFSSAKKGV
jgi:transposase